MRFVSKPIIWTSALALAGFIGGGAFAQQAQQGQGGQGSSQQLEQESAPGSGAELSVSPATVRQIQQKLNQEGYDVGAVDGAWGQKTQRAVMNFQQAQGLEPTGQLNQSTLAALGIQMGSGQGQQGQQGQGMGQQQGQQGQGGSQGGMQGGDQQIEQEY